MGVRRGGTLRPLRTGLGPSAERPHRVFGAGGEDCDSYRQTQYIPAQSALVFERDGHSVQVSRDPVRTITVIVTSSDGRYNQTRADPHVEPVDGIDLGTTFGFEWVAPGEAGPGSGAPGAAGVGVLGGRRSAVRRVSRQLLHAVEAHGELLGPGAMGVLGGDPEGRLPTGGRRVVHDRHPAGQPRRSTGTSVQA